MKLLSNDNISANLCCCRDGIGEEVPETVTFGDVDIYVESQYHQSRDFRSFQHYMWDPAMNTLLYDIAVLYLPNPVSITNYVRPVCLATETPEVTRVPGQMSNYRRCYATGWGATRDPLEGGKCISDATITKVPG